MKRHKMGMHCLPKYVSFMTLSSPWKQYFACRDRVDLLMFARDRVCLGLNVSEVCVLTTAESRAKIRPVKLIHSQPLPLVASVHSKAGVLFLLIRSLFTLPPLSCYVWCVHWWEAWQASYVINTGIPKLPKDHYELRLIATSSCTTTELSNFWLLA